MHRLERFIEKIKPYRRYALGLRNSDSRYFSFLAFVASYLLPFRSSKKASQLEMIGMGYDIARAYMSKRERPSE